MTPDEINKDTLDLLKLLESKANDILKIVKAAQENFAEEDGQNEGDGSAPKHVAHKVRAGNDATDGGKPGPNDGRRPKGRLYASFLDLQTVDQEDQRIGKPRAFGVTAGEGTEGVGAFCKRRRAKDQVVAGNFVPARVQ